MTHIKTWQGIYKWRCHHPLETFRHTEDSLPTWFAAEFMRLGSLLSAKREGRKLSIHDHVPHSRSEQEPQAGCCRSIWIITTELKLSEPVMTLNDFEHSNRSYLEQNIAYSVQDVCCRRCLRGRQPMHTMVVHILRRAFVRGAECYVWKKWYTWFLQSFYL